jgi:hypothetical protein
MTKRAMTRSIGVVVAFLAALGAAGCGGHSQAASARPLAKVNPALVPSTIDGLTVQEDAKAKDRFAKLSKNALVADGRMYAFRQGERLVATLQLSTLMPEVDLTNQKRHDEMAEKLMTGVKQQLRIDNTDVFQAAGDEKTEYMWFGRQMFEVLQVKGSTVKPEDMLKDIISFQQSSHAWEPLPAGKEGG